MKREALRRREFIALLGGAVAGWPLAARAQTQTMPVVAFFTAGSPASFNHLAVAFREGLGEIGFVEGRNIAIEYRWAEDRYDQLPALAADLVQRRVAVIASSPRATEAAIAATSSIPIVFMGGGDPVRTGLVASLNRPGGNRTGATILAPDLTAKRLRLLHDAMPNETVIGVLSDSTSPANDFVVQSVQEAARSLGLQTRVRGARTEAQVDAAFSDFSREGVRAVFINSAFLFFSALREPLAALAARHRLAATYELREHVDAGGLMSYGPSLREAFRQVGRYTGRILKGEKPGDLPVMLPTKIDFVINLQNAKALGLEIPPAIISAADEVIE